MILTAENYFSPEANRGGVYVLLPVESVSCLPCPCACRPARQYVRPDSTAALLVGHMLDSHF